MARGKVKRWDPGRKIGWIVDNDDRAEVFFDSQGLWGIATAEIQADLEVEYDRAQNDRGPVARKVRRERPIPRSLQRLLESGCIPPLELHPGLSLDKFARPCSDQKQQRAILGEVAHLPGDGALLEELLHRRDGALAGLGTSTWTRATAGRLTLHLARASVLENAGLCFHPLYGFACIPGTGLKGLARAYAETVWIVSLPIADQAHGWERIETIFGWAPGSDLIEKGRVKHDPAMTAAAAAAAPGSDLIEKGRVKPWKPEGVRDHDEGDSARAGSIVFHDAWPTSWPRLIVDIVNNHHPSYYRGEGPPGDWDSPNPVYFLAVPPGQQFSFGLQRRRDDVDKDDLRLAREWLDGALTHLGCGAKTSAGYGRFVPPPVASGREDPTAMPVETVWSGALAAPPNGGGIPRAEWSGTLELTTPAFLAGARPEDPDDCDLRPATLRGLLRWWWRTMHSGYLSRQDLALIEARLWGDTDQGGAVQVALRPVQRPSAILFNHRDPGNRFAPDLAFARQHQLERPPHKTTQGLFYVSFGMDERSRGEIRQRFYLEAGARWELRMTARAARPPVGSPRAEAISREMVLDQAVAALGLLSMFGGVGSKSRKGFGSLQVSGSASSPLSIAELIERSAAFRRHLGKDQSFQTGWLESPSLQNAIRLDPPVRTPWSDPWTVLDSVGFAYQSFMQSKKHQRDKAAMGLPRKIHGPNDEPIRSKSGVSYQDESAWHPPEWLDFPDRPKKLQPKDARYGSPVHIHLARGEDGSLTVQALAFPAGNLPDLDTSTRVLGSFLDHFRQDLEIRADRPPVRTAPREPERRRPPAPVLSGPAIPKVNDAVDARLLPERTKKGGWRAIHEPTGYSGHLVDSEKVAADKQPGDMIRLFVNSTTPEKKQIVFRVNQERHQP